MEDFLNWLEMVIIGRIDGPLHFRLLLQPAMAVFLAVRDGRADARMGKSPYFWSLFTEPEKRGKKMREGWKSVSKVFLLAIVLDLVYQFLALPEVHPLRSVIVAAVLAIIPYVALRGVFTRFLSSANKEGPQL